MRNIAFIVGSLSRQSVNRHIAEHILKNAPADVQAEEIRIHDLPLYTQDLDEQAVPSYERVRNQLKRADAVLIVSPEHNRSIPAALKNILDIATRPFGQNLWANKKIAVVNASPGTYGGINAGVHLRQILQAVGADTLVAPEIYLSKASLNIDERTGAFLDKFAASFFNWVNKD